MPIALFMGLYLRYLRPGKVLESSLIGFVLVMAAIFGGQAVSQSPALGAALHAFGCLALAFAIILYGFLASALPVWLLLAPRDYLSTFVKLGVILLLAVGILLVRPELQLPAFTRFTDGTGPIFAGKIFPFCFITIACGAVSGFHSLISSGTTPKMIAKERHALARRLRLHAARKLRGHHGHDRRVLVAAGRLFRGELAGRRGRRDPRGARPPFPPGASR